MRLKQLSESYRAILSDPLETVIPVIVKTKEGQIIAVPLGEKRVSGDLDYASSDPNEMLDIAAALENQKGFDNVRVIELQVGEGHFYMIQWGEHPGEYPHNLVDAEGHRRLGEAYGYKPEAIEDFIDSVTGSILVSFAKYIEKHGIQNPEQFSSQPIAKRIEIVKAFSGEPFHILGALQGGVLRPFPEAVTA